jgi:hypothetical protein
MSLVHLTTEVKGDFESNSRSNFAMHLIQNNDSIGPIENIMNVIHLMKKGGPMNIL